MTWTFIHCILPHPEGGLRVPLRHLFIDMNSYFASVEQQHNPALRGKPVAVIPTRAETTACIAASYEAKACGVKTGTPVWEARKLCPNIVFKEADHQEYVLMHNRIVDAVGSCVPVEQVVSIDEMTGKLVGEEQQPERAAELARRIKAAIYDRAGDYMRCSIGIGPNVLLSKIAADMHKPDGLTVLRDGSLPDALYQLKLTDFPGVARRMERRLQLHGMCTAEQLCKAPVQALAAAWGSRVIGEKWFRLLRGEDVPEKPTRRQTVSHSHVLPPELRTDAGAYGVLVKLTHKAAARLRRIGYWAGAVSVGVSYTEGYGTVPDPVGWGRASWGTGCRFPHRQDTPGILQEVSNLWGRRPPGGVPFKIGMALADLRPARSATPSLFEADRRQGELSHAMDEVNREFGSSVVYFGSMFGMRDAAPTRIAFTQIPDFDRRVT
jgi:DNA polymerase-4